MTADLTFVQNLVDDAAGDETWIAQIPAGTYDFGLGTLQVPSGVVLQGAGVTATVLEQTFTTTQVSLRLRSSLRR